MTTAIFSGYFFVLATIVSGTFLEIDTHPAFIAGVVFVLAAAWSPGAPATALWSGRPAPVWTMRAVLLGALACLPAALGLAASWRQEFPFAGDAAFHISTHFNTALFWASPIGSAASGVDRLDPWRARGLVLFVSIAAVAAVAIWKGARAGLLAAGLLAALWAAIDSFPLQRYPGLVYFLGIPFNTVFFAVAPDEAATSPRIVAFLALPAWLFVLRPLLIGRTPDGAGVLAGLLLFWGERQIYWQSAPYLETWAICGVLLALETLHTRGARGSAAACLCIGAAACAKEQAILFLPFVWLAGRPWRPAEAGEPSRLDRLVAGFAAGLPFVFHAVLRARVPPKRNLAENGFEPSAWLDGTMVWASRIPEYFADAAYVPFGIALVGLGVALNRPAWRGGALAALAGAFTGMLVYTIDSTGPDGFSDSLAGYYRFAAPLLPALAVGAFALADRFETRKAVAALVTVMAIAQAPGAISGVRLMAAESERRTGLEDGNGTMYVPLRALLDAAERDGALARGSPVVVAAPTRFVAYHRAATNGRDLRFVDASGFECGCAADRPAAIAVYLLRNPRAAEFAGVPRVSELALAPGTRGEPGAPPAAYPACRAAFEATCRYVRTREVDGVPTGILGAGPR
jgi:hypothetical protein